ncbi:hypothetical protein HPB51_020008 [Rhipicephalus microplus]|uniref:Uncharacterized protein n=1 Tax=Rhipicephalus microplus TaxID=6941 RepID=A0A9J6E416_RHIMP|nr:hypothetical protein HPB51_020008 [Rhipicephalus microplus]
MPDDAKKFRSQHDFRRSRKKGRKPNGAAIVSREQAPTLFDNAIVTKDGSFCVRGVAAGRPCTGDVINGGACKTVSPDSGHSVNHDRADAIGNGKVRVDTGFPDSARYVDSDRVRIDADVIDASEVHDVNTRETTTTLEGLSSVSATARKIEHFSESSGVAARQGDSKARLRILTEASNPCFGVSCQRSSTLLFLLRKMLLQKLTLAMSMHLLQF